MKVILLQSVPKVGKKGDVVDVASGYAEHALFPKKLAVAATPKALATLARQKQNAVSEREVRHALLDKAILSLNNQHLTMRVKTNAQGSLFSKIHPGDIARYLMEQHRIAIDPLLLTLPDGFLKKLGTFAVAVTDEDYHATFTITLEQE